MKQRLLLKTMLLLCALIAGSGSVWAATYKLTKVTSVSAGNKYVFERNGYVLSNSVSSNALQTAGTYSTTSLVGNEAYVWTLESATDGFYLKNASLSSNQYLNNTKDKTNMSFGNKSSIWTIAFTDGVALISNTSNANRFLGDTGGPTPNNTYKAYATSNLDTYAHDFTVYVLEEETAGSDPSASLSATSLAFGRVKVNATKEMTFTVTPANLTAALSIASDNAKYTVSPTSIAQATTAETTITVTAAPTAIDDDMDGTITISGGGLAANKTVSLSTIVRAADANDGTAAKPYTVAEAIELIDEDGPSSDKTGKYVKGVISQIDQVNTTDGWATYWISDDGTTTNQFEAYKGKYLENAAFTSADQIEVSDKVVIVGDLTKFGTSTYEFGAGNILYSQTKDTRDYADISFANAEVSKLDSDGSHTQIATVSQGNYNGTISYAITASTSTGATINSTTGEVSFSKTGSITVTATAAETVDYKAKTASYTLKIKTEPTILVENKSVAYGSTFTVDESLIEGGDITVTSGNTAISTVDGLVITPIAVGSATITVTTAANDTYIAGSETFVLTVTAPVASTTKPSLAVTTTFKNKDLEYDGTGIDWTASIGANSFESSGSARGVQFGAAVGAFTLSSSAITGTITKVSMVVATNGDANSNSISVKVGESDFLNGENKTYSMPKSNDQNVEFTGTASGTVVISVNDDSKSVYFKSITVEKAAAVPVTIATSGYGTYCCQYPLSIPADNDKYKAYIVTAVDEATVTFSPISGTIKGGVPFILYGTAGTYNIPMADESETVPAGNMLTGTLAPTYITTVTGDYTNFGLSGGSFVKINDGTLPANKAYLPVLTANLPSSSAPEFTIIFEDMQTTGVNAVKGEGFTVNGYYDLQGRKVTNPTKGMYIVNGKKVIVK